MRDNDLLAPRPLITRRRLLALGAGAGSLGIGWPLTRAAVRVEITSGDVQPMPIALPDFVGGTTGDTEAARSVTQIIAGDLKRSGLFAPIDPAAYIERIVNTDAVPRFEDWRPINAQALLTGRLTRQQYFTTPDMWRRVAHIIADSVYERLTGEKGYFDTRVVFVDETGPKDRRVKRLAIMDQDGANV